MPAGVVDQMFSVNQMVWWQGTAADKGQAAILGDHPSWAEARKFAGLGWEAESFPVFEWAGVTTEQLRKQFGGTLVAAKAGDIDLNAAVEQLMAAHGATFTQIAGWQQVKRSDDGATLSLNQDSYEIISHEAFGRIFEGVLQQTNVKFETGGSLDGGKKVWMLVRLDEPRIIKGRRGRTDGTYTMPYLALTSNHTGKGSTILRLTTVRIVCGNTFNMSEMEGEQTGAEYSFIHRGDWESHIEDARQAVLNAREGMRRYERLAGDLLDIRVTRKQTEHFITMFAPIPEENVLTPTALRNIEAIRQGLRDLIAGPTIAGAGIDGTAFGLVQAAGEHLDHKRKANSWGSRLNRSLLKPEKLKREAIILAREAANA